MARRIVEAFYRAVLRRPFWVIAVLAVVLAGAAWQARHFELDASAESLMVQGDRDLETYREVRSRFGSDDILFVTYSPEQPLFGEESLDAIESLSAELGEIERVESVTSILNVPLVEAADATFSSLQEGLPTLEDVPLDAARRELQTSPVYDDLLVNDAGDTTAIVVQLARDDELRALLEQRRELREARAGEGLSGEQRAELAELDRRIEARRDALQAQSEADIARIRAILDDYRDGATVHLGGATMIAVDMIDFVASDIRVFGIAVALFIVVLLALTFGRPRWVAVPALICGSVVVAMTGWIGLAGWPVTVVSSNFISLVLIITLSLIVHLIVRYRELHRADPSLDQPALLRETIHSKLKPSLFTSLTTALSFASLLLADIQPVKDFGLMMTCSVVFGFVLTFLLFPSLLAPLSPAPIARARHDWTARANVGLSRLVRGRPWATAAAFAVLAVAGVGGAMQLTVENRFIDYFHEDTEIYQGMRLIDRELGGTTPLDVVLSAPESFLEDYRADREFAAEMGLAGEPNPAEGYWYNAHNLDRAVEIQDYLEGLDATGKILSMGTLWEMALTINDGEALEPYELGVLYNRVPAELREQLIDPYMTPDGNTIRFQVRVIDSLPGLQRDELLERIRSGLVERFEFEPDQVTLSGLLVLYNNVLQSLFHSQVVTLAVVFAGILVMFGLLYRSARMALIGPVPTAVAAVLVLGLMGWIGLPLDIMTMTIAAIVIGIGVDDTIHYVDRYQTEIAGGADHASAADTAHREVGRAMVYTTVIITLGFSILTLSNFVPTIYFGLLTGLAMVLALVSNLALLPVLLGKVRPFRAAA